MNRRYIRIEDGKVKVCPMNDYDGKITGKIIFNVPAYFDENPDEARRLGWTLHKTRDMKDIKKLVDWDPRTQYLVTTMRQVDEWTVEDVYHVADKSEEMLLREELGTAHTYYSGGIEFESFDWGEL